MTSKEKNKPRTRVEQRESDILEAATQLFAEEGFHGSSTRKIAAQAGLSEGTLFHYFNTKNDLLLAILDEFYSELITSAQEGVQDIMGTRERLLFLAKNHLRSLMANHALMMRLIQVYLSVNVNYYLDYKSSPLYDLNLRYTRIFDNAIREGIERGYIKQDLELSALRDLFFGGLEYGIRTLKGRNYSADKIEAYVEALVDPLWASMQENNEESDMAKRGDENLEKACKRLEKIALRLEKNLK
ncbi:MAG: TetR/AcrR family transcriptional regulator [Halioglobus sp.]